MANYKGTDTEFTAVANAIRAKGWTSSPLEWPSGFISAIQAIDTGRPDKVSFADATGEQMTAIIQAAHDGVLDLQQDMGWQIGDRKLISTGTMLGLGPYNNIPIVISSFDDYMNCGCVMQFDFPGAFYSSSIGPGNTIGYGYTAMYTTVLPGMVSGLPEWLRNLLIEFSCLAYDGTNIQTVTGNKLCLRSLIEVFDSGPEDGSHIPYYVSGKRAKGRIQNADTGSYNYWFRTCASNGTYASTKDSSYRIEQVEYGNQNRGRGVSPFGCI